ncbi:hypothetical protein [Marinactinospora rubrisoli]|uniref:Uncharacterized protein n=1 Tax=Marinactinospora rubrisoli TaxID=2715399 RepID=A0ABW2KH78_9ACTN
MTSEPVGPGESIPFAGRDLAGYVLVPAEWVEQYEDLIDGGEIDRVKDDIRAGRDEMVPFRVADFERAGTGARSRCRLGNPCAGEALSEELHWLVGLPVEERSQAIGELLDHLLAGVETREFGPFVRAMDAWRSTAVAWSDPDGARRLMEPFDGTGGEVIGRPGV